MRKLFVLIAALTAALAVSATPAPAITGNYVEDFEHEYVGLVVFYDENGEFSHRCSGTLISPSVLLTAGHCTDGASSARVYFHQAVGANYDPVTQIDPTTGYPEHCLAGDPLCYTAETLYTYGNFSGFPNTKDLGVVILDEPVTFTNEFASLAAAGSLDRLATQRGRQNTTFTISGYGLSRINPVFVESYRSRLMATTTLVNLRSALTGGYNLQTSAAPAGEGRGGTCFGDSGGPVFYDATNVIVGVTSFGLNGNCVGVDFAYRTDRQEVIDWILAHVPEDERDDIQIVAI